MADDVAVDVGEHIVEDHEVGGEFLGEDAGVVAGGGGFDFEAAIAVEDVDEEFDDFGVVVHDEDFAAAGVEVVERYAGVVFHEVDECVAGDAAEFGAGDAETAEAAGVEAADDGLLGNGADFSGFAGGVDFLEGRGRGYGGGRGRGGGLCAHGCLRAGGGWCGRVDAASLPCLPILLKYPKFTSGRWVGKFTGRWRLAFLGSRCAWGAAKRGVGRWHSPSELVGIIGIWDGWEGDKRDRGGGGGLILEAVAEPVGAVCEGCVVGLVELGGGGLGWGAGEVEEGGDGGAAAVEDGAEDEGEFVDEFGFEQGGVEGAAAVEHEFFEFELVVEFLEGEGEVDLGFSAEEVGDAGVAEVGAVGG